MTRAMISLALAAFTACHADASVESPETVIQVSISELLPKKRPVSPKKQPPAAKLPDAYARQLAEAISLQRKNMLDCLDVEGAKSLSFAAEMRVMQNGRVRAVQPNGLGTPGPTADCVMHVLKRTSLPGHVLSSDVIVKFPISLEREEL